MTTAITENVRQWLAFVGLDPTHDATDLVHELRDAKHLFTFKTPPWELRHWTLLALIRRSEDHALRSNLMLAASAHIAHVAPALVRHRDASGSGRYLAMALLNEVYRGDPRAAKVPR